MWLHKANLERRVHQRFHEFVADAVLVRPAGRPEEARVALALMGGGDELDQALAAPAR